MSTPKQQYDQMLDDLDSESKIKMIDHAPFAKVLEEVDPIAYRCGLNDFGATCDECGRDFYPDDPDEEAICEDCQEEEEEEEV